MRHTDENIEYTASLYYNDPDKGWIKIYEKITTNRPMFKKDFDFGVSKRIRG